MILRGSFYSKVLKMETSIAVLFPREVDQTKPQKVVYLLHGLGGNHESWLNNTMLPVYSEKFNLVFVMPEVQRSLYTDLKYGGAYFSYLSLELPRIIADCFNVSTLVEDTIIIGASIGGYGALKCALNYPERFGTCIALSSAALETSQARLQELNADELLSPTYGEQIAKDLIVAFGEDLKVSEKDDLLLTAKQVSHKVRPKLYLSCGAQDDLLTKNREFSYYLTKMGWEHTFREIPGGHDWLHFNAALLEGLRWARRVTY